MAEEDQTLAKDASASGDPADPNKMFVDEPVEQQASDSFVSGIVDGIQYGPNEHDELLHESDSESESDFRRGRRSRGVDCWATS